MITLSIIEHRGTEILISHFSFEFLISHFSFLIFAWFSNQVKRFERAEGMAV